jgi:hypothetical protein
MAMDDIYDVINWILTKLATVVPEAELVAAREALNKAAAKASAPAPAPVAASPGTAAATTSAQLSWPAKKQETPHA